MKKLLTIALLLCSIGVMGQTGIIGATQSSRKYVSSIDTLPNGGFGTVQWDINSLIGSANTIVKSKSDTTVLNKGHEIHSHEWAYKKKVISNISCCVYHGETGCPDNWPNDFRICSACLRHENIRITYYSVEVPDKYEEALKKINP